MIVSHPRPSRPLSVSSFTPFSTSRLTLSVERPSTRYAISPTILWDAADRGTHYRLNLLLCARAQTPAPANAHSAYSRALQTSSWIFRRTQSFEYSRKVYRIDRASRFVSPHLVSHSSNRVCPTVGPPCRSSRLRILPHLLRSTPNRTILISHVPHA